MSLGVAESRRDVMTLLMEAARLRMAVSTGKGMLFDFLGPSSPGWFVTDSIEPPMGIVGLVGVVRLLDTLSTLPRASLVFESCENFLKSFF